MASTMINRYKDELPAATIRHTRDTLASHGIFATETWNNVGNQIYSVHLSVPNTTITSNGKGCNKEFALASAYGELIERLSFLLPFRMSAFYMLFYEKLKENIGNIRQDSDQLKSLDFKEWLFSRDADLYSYLLAANPVEQINKTNSLEGQNFRKIWNEWQNTINYELGASFHELHPDDMLKDDSSTLLLPYSILDYYYGSNGMCAGNSFEEAVVQGLCEIIERYVQKRLVLGVQEIIYNVSSFCIDKSKSISQAKQILNENNYDITLLECPTPFSAYVIAAIVRTKNHGAYYVSLGCHPDIIIAAERAVDELFQGYNITTLSSAMVTDFIINANAVSMHENYINLLKFGVGKYPLPFIVNSFPVKSDYELAEYQNNKQLLNVLVESINSSGNRVFISKGFDLGLFTYQIVIPGISEAEDILPSGKIRHSGGKSIYDDLRHINSDDALALAERCSILFSTGETTLAQLLDIEKYASYTNATTPVDGISASIFIALLYIRCHRWGRAAKYIHIYCSELDANVVENSSVEYYKVIETVLLMLDSGMDISLIVEGLSNNTYDISSMLDELINGEHLFDDIPLLTVNKLINESADLSRAMDNESKLMNQIACDK